MCKNYGYFKFVLNNFTLLVKYLLTPAILLSFMFLHPIFALVVFMTLFALRIHVTFFAEMQAWGSGSAASLQEQNLHEFVKACFFLFSLSCLYVQTKDCSTVRYAPFFG